MERKSSLPQDVYEHIPSGELTGRQNRAAVTSSAGDVETTNGGAAMSEPRLPTEVDTSTPNVARMYDYALGGKDNFAVDRAAMQEIFAGVPYGPRPALENRAFLGRAVHFLASAGIRQFLDVGSGLPTQGNVHEVAPSVAPEARVVYVDYDPVAVAHARALLSGIPTASAVHADIRRPDELLARPEVTSLIDFGQPVAILLVAIAHVLRDEDGPDRIVRRFREAMTPGSYLVLSHITSHQQPPGYISHLRAVFDRAREPMVPGLMRRYSACSKASNSSNLAWSRHPGGVRTPAIHRRRRPA